MSLSLGNMVFLLMKLQKKNLKTKKCGTTIRHIDDKKVLPACASNKFEKITYIFEFEL
jgi:hypothetical protein